MGSGLKLFTLSVFFAGSISSAQACPDLTGTFACPADQSDGPTTLVIGTRQQPGEGADKPQWIYAVKVLGADGREQSSSETLADGKPHHYTDPSSGMTVPVVMVCEDETTVRLTTDYELNGIGHISAVMHMKLDAQKNFSQVTDVQTARYGNSHSERTCLRQRH